MKPQPWCPVAFAARTFSGKWKPLILLHLKDGPRRFGELRRLIPTASQRALTMQLRALEQDGLLWRNDLSAVALHVEYSLTEKAMTLGPILDAVFEWGELHGPTSRS